MMKTYGKRVDQIIGLTELINVGRKQKSAIIKTSIVISILFSTLILIFVKEKTFDYIIEVDNILINIIPNLLGFSIAAFSFLTGFLPKELMQRISKPQREDDFSLYQKITSSFAYNILQLTFILIIAIIISLIVNIQKGDSLKLITESCYIKSINLIFLYFINLMLSITLAIIIQIIVSSFNLAQLFHYEMSKSINKTE